MIVGFALREGYDRVKMNGLASRKMLYIVTCRNDLFTR